MVNAAQSFIKLYREYRNGVLSESELIDAVEPLNREITCLFLEQSDLPYPPKELHEWANTHTQLAGTIQDFLYIMTGKPQYMDNRKQNIPHGFIN